MEKKEAKEDMEKEEKREKTEEKEVEKKEEVKCCKDCPTVNIKDHQYHVHRNTILLFGCEVCGFKSRTYMSMVNHTVRSHCIDIPPILCEEAINSSFKKSDIEITWEPLVLPAGGRNFDGSTYDRSNLEKELLVKKAQAEESMRQAEAGLKIIEEEKNKRKFEKLEEDNKTIEAKVKRYKKDLENAEADKTRLRRERDEYKKDKETYKKERDEIKKKVVEAKTIGDLRNIKTTKMMIITPDVMRGSTVYRVESSVFKKIDTKTDLKLCEKDDELL